MKLAIVFGDNDFVNTFNGVLKSIFEIYLYDPTLNLDKDRLCWIINKLSPVFYIARQADWESGQGSGLVSPQDLINDKDFLITENHVMIHPSQILLNEEVDKYLEQIAWNNGETFILDTSLHTNNIYSI